MKSGRRKVAIMLKEKEEGGAVPQRKWRVHSLVTGKDVGRYVRARWV